MARDQLYMQDLMYDRPEQWQDKANCRGKALELFEYQEKDSPLAAGMSFKERLAFNQTNFQLAEEVCIECPVFFQCEQNATDEEKFWTVRGGNAPGRIEVDVQRYANQGRPKLGRVVDGGRMCGRDHFVPGGGDCGECRKENNRKWMQAKRKGVAKTRPKAGEDRVCDRGHEVPGGGKCTECKRIMDRYRRERNRRLADV